MIDLSKIGRLGYDMLFWHTPYRTGNLAHNGVSDFKTVGSGVGWTMFGIGTEYGAILNEVPIISYKITNPNTGIFYQGMYKNRHYKWLNNFADTYAGQIPIYFPNVRRV